MNQRQRGKTPVLKTECNDVDLVEVYQKHPSPKMRALAAREMTTRDSIQEKWAYARDVLKMDRAEFNSVPWSYANTVQRRYWEEAEREASSKTNRGGLLVYKDWEAEKRRVIETSNRLRALYNMPPL